MLTPFCPGNDSLRPAWSQHGLGHCFVETTLSSTLFVWIAFCWIVEYYLYLRYSIRIETADRGRPSRLFRLQVAATLLLPVMAMVRFVLQATVYPDTEMYGYRVMALVLGMVIWPASLAVVLMERRYALPSIPTWGHSLGLLLFWTLAFVGENLAFLSFRSPNWWFVSHSLSDKLELGMFILRYVLTLTLFVLGLKAPGVLSRDNQSMRIRHRRLLEEGVQTGAAGPDAASTQNRSTFRDMWKKLKVLFPLMWPKKERLLQFYVIVCVGILIAGRIVNLFTPIFYKKIVDSLSLVQDGQSLVFRWDLILMYGFFMLLQGGGAGGSGLLTNTRNFVWIKIQQYTVRELQVQLYTHLHNLSLHWHLKRKTGEVLRAVDRGTNSITSLFNYILFNIVPTVADILIAVIFFVTAFNAWFGLIIFVTMIVYLVATIKITEWRTQFRRAANRLDNASNSKAVDSLLNFETVKYYGAEEYEVNQYKDAILEFQKEDWKSSASMTVLNGTQSAIITLGLVSSALLCAHLVVTKQGLTAGDYVLLGTYILQLYGPLNFFGTYYRMIQQAFIDMENMFDLLYTEQDVKDAEDAVALELNGGEVHFKDVHFSYVPERQILKGVSFTVPTGKKVALVGPTGSGKTTIVRLLFRFYDIQHGEILIDGHNIAEVTQKSLRQAIGVVPQDTVLFNNTIRYNIRYGRVTANDEEVEKAAEAAEMHEQISVFPDGYNTIVGERGLKLSGGEKQRVAIARTILKEPAIILLDEATSALDTRTERQIQKSLSKISANKTTLVVAHRLSTIIDADEIIVLKSGEIVERGSHDNLLQLDGLYAQMWQQQLKKSVDEQLEHSIEISDDNSPSV